MLAHFASNTGVIVVLKSQLNLLRTLQTLYWSLKLKLKIIYHRSFTTNSTIYTALHHCRFYKYKSRKNLNQL